MDFLVPEDALVLTVHLEGMELQDSLDQRDELVPQDLVDCQVALEHLDRLGEMDQMVTFQF